jgi:hypothetical protein
VEARTSVIVAWVVFPLLLAALGAGWGGLVERASGRALPGVLLVPVGLAAVLVVAGTVTAFAGIAKAASPTVGAGALAGLIWTRPWRRVERWPVVVAVVVLLAYGAPVLLSGTATFTGFVRLDDTAAWFGAIDHVFSHARSVAGLDPNSTYTLFYTTDIGKAYPLGAFMILGAARGLLGTDVAWVFQPYLAASGAALSLALLALLGSGRRAAIAAGLGALPALLYGYGLWGGIKELTAAWLLATGVALLATATPPRGRSLIPLGACAGALLCTLGPGAAAWLLPALALVTVMWRAWRPLLWIVAATVACAVPLWLTVGDFLAHDQGLFSAGQDPHTRLGNLVHPLSGFQLAGVWTTGDFRATPSFFPTTPLVVLVLAAALVGIVRRRGLALYAGVALAGCAFFAVAGATPWATGKALAISSPALLVCALAGVLLARRRAWLVVGALIAAGVVGSAALAYRDTSLAPHDRLAELAHVGELVDGHGPTFLNEYDVYATRHFLRAGAPVEPADFRAATLPTTSGAVLTKAAAADLDAFAPETLAPYRSLVVPRSPTASDPASPYRRVWRGRFYELWRRTGGLQVIRHLPLGDQGYCGNASNQASRPLCPIAPVAVPDCATVRQLGRLAASVGGTLVADQRPAPVSARGDQVLWPGTWLHDPDGHTLTPTTPGTAVMHFAVSESERYGLWLGGSFSRGIDVSIDGVSLGRVQNEIAEFRGEVHVADVRLPAGVHTIRLTYPHADLTPGSAESSLTLLASLTAAPLQPTRRLRVAPTAARTLCGRTLDWIDVVRAGPAAPPAPG